MTTLRTAAQQALEALELGYDSAKAEADQYHAAMAGYRPQRHAQMDADVQQIATAITSLKAALAEPVWVRGELPPPYVERSPIQAEPPTDWEAVAADQAMTIAMLRSEEPVAWMVYTLDGKSVCVTDNPADFTDEHRVLPLYTAPPQRKED